jgi:hypothetical protein
MAFGGGGGYKGWGGRHFFGERVEGTHFSAREEDNTGNKGNDWHFRGLEGSKIAQTSLLGPF